MKIKLWIIFVHIPIMFMLTPFALAGEFADYIVGMMDNWAIKLKKGE